MSLYYTKQPNIFLMIIKIDMFNISKVIQGILFAYRFTINPHIESPNSTVKNLV